MDERDEVSRLIERVLRESGIADARARDDLRRELQVHFEDAGSSPEALRAALERFGSVDEIGLGLEQAHRRGRRAWYVAKVTASLLVATGIAFVIQAIAKLWLSRTADLPHLPSAGSLDAAAGLVIALIAVAGWELGIAPLCTRLERRPLALLGITAALGGGVYFTHQALRHVLEPEVAAVIGAVLAVSWISAITIVSRFDRAYLRFLGTH